MPSDTCIIVPARYNSSRFPGKPLHLIKGKPLIIHVLELCSRVLPLQHVYLATDSVSIHKVASDHGFKSIMTSSHCLTGTDRVAEASSHLDYDYFINVQGDEPLVDPCDIQECIRLVHSNPLSVHNGYSNLLPCEDPTDKKIPKVVISKSTSNLLYISRSPIPSSKSTLDRIFYHKQVCIYGFSRDHLVTFLSCNQKTYNESLEDIEIIRFLELGIPVSMFYCAKPSLSVDYPEDVFNVEPLLS